MAGEDDPFEQYFKPRPAGAEGPGGPVADDSGIGWEAVVVEGEGAQRVQVTPPRHRRSSGMTAYQAARKRRLLVVTAAASSLVLLGSGTAWAFQEFLKGSLRTNDIDMGKGGETGPKGAMNILLAGVDRRDGMKPEDIKRLHLGREQGARSDTMMVVHISEKHDKVTIVSLPRDSLVTIPGRGQGKLTWAYSYGGAQLMKDTIQNFTGVRLDHYVEVNFNGFLKVVNEVGGVDICTETAINDKASGLVLTPGTHHVQGPEALAFARARHGLGEDIGRMQRQQQFLSALMNAAIAKAKSNPLAAGTVLRSVLGAVTVDKGLKQNIDGLAAQFKDLSLGSVEFAKVPIDNPAGTAFMGGINQSVVLVDGSAMRKMFRKIINDEPLKEPKPAPASGQSGLTVPPSQISFRVRNGVGTKGIAKLAANGLNKVGFHATWVIGVVQRADTKTTLIRYGPGRADSARTLAASIPFAKLKKVDALGGTMELIVGSAWAKPKPVTIAGQPTVGEIETRSATDNLCK
ncbi:LCP family protein [Actinocorallia longicatena]|uniref:LCP family protein n=1 Tax=Actinocorallia longicatena TaxID=111803 RepID=A0ABP6QNK9_9ACTN